MAYLSSFYGTAEALKVIKELEEMSGASLDLSHYIAKVYASLNEKEVAGPRIGAGSDRGFL